MNVGVPINRSSDFPEDCFFRYWLDITEEVSSDSSTSLISGRARPNLLFRLDIVLKLSTKFRMTESLNAESTSVCSFLFTRK